MKINPYRSLGRIPWVLNILKHFKKGYLVLMYHSTSKKPKNYSYNLEIEKFKKQILHIQNNLEIEPLREVPEKTPNKLKAAITFDDGYLNNHKNAVPFLKEHSIPATFFITPKYIKEGEAELGKGDQLEPMNWKQIKELSETNLFTIGSHGYTHNPLTKNNCRKELKKSKDAIEEKIDKKVKFVSYPHGEHNKEVRKEAKRIGYKAGFTSEKKINTGKTDPYNLGRIGIISKSPTKI